MQKWFHAIGISGKATANIALMFKEMGWFVTGSDHQFLPPASDIVEENNIPYVTEYNFRHLTKEFWEKKLSESLDIAEVPDLVMIVESLSSKNKEYLFAKNKGIDVRPYSQIFRDYLVKEHSIVVTGSAGKTTTTAIITIILSELGFDPSYMVGAEVNGLEKSLSHSDSTWSVIEGDEYHNKDLANGAKFLEYKPKHVVLTNLVHEHQDIFPTLESYLDEFKKLAKIVPEDGLIVARNGDKNIDEVLKESTCNIVKYMVAENIEDVPHGVWSLVRDGSEFVIYDGYKGEVLRSRTELLGEFVLEDMLASVTLICNLPAYKIPVEIVPKGTAYLTEIADSLQNFKGVKKRLEQLYKNDNLVIIDDFGVAPNRAKNSIKVLRDKYPEHYIVGVFEPNSGSRIKDELEFKKTYEGVFAQVDELIIPDLSEFNSELATTTDLVAYLKDLGVFVNHEETKNLISKLDKVIKENDKTLVVFFSAYRLDIVSKELASKYQNS
ncbi:hypothetical protein KC669_03730 [Candidatus Dojkabacteria bacterium]|uniref:Mur ligase central domain-containing protein n=1 Tax=Candidatus Dojkabacteria bacterium TaxID=2099670 RepID=A0A955RM89_9BACT|nr:hypothetical protein [Candidatus Dojkabacteria bacterium]